MVKRLLDDDENTDDLQDIIRDLFVELGGNVPIRVLATEAITRGAIPESVLRRCQLRGVSDICRQALRAETDEELPFAQPTGRGSDDPWLQLDLFTYNRAELLLQERAEDLRRDNRKLRRLWTWCFEKFGRAPEIPQLVELSEA